MVEFSYRTEQAIQRAQPVKTHLVLQGMAFCDFQSRNGGRLAATSATEFKAASDRCKECEHKLTKMRERNRASRP